MNSLLLPPPRLSICNQWDHWTLTKEQLVERNREIRRGLLYQYALLKSERILCIDDELREQRARLGEAALELLEEQVQKASFARANRVYRQKWSKVA